MLLSSAHMRAAAILGLGCSAKALKPFQADKNVEWRLGMPVPSDAVDLVLLFGGDGTIHRHLGQLVRLGLPILVVPTGSGNDFARALGIRRVRDSVAAWRKFCSSASNIRAIDLGIISGRGEGGSASHGHHYFCCVAGLGLDSEVARRANRLPRWLRGHGGYALTLIPTIFRFAPVPMKIKIPGGSAGWTTRSDKPTMLAAFANAPAYGGGMKIAPRAKMDDGLLDVCVVGGVDPFKLFCMSPTVYVGKHLKIREVEYFRTERARIETEHPVEVYADGEYVCQTPMEVRLQCGALKVVTSCS